MIRSESVDTFSLILLGMVLGMALIVMGSKLYPRSKINLYDEAIAECEKNLPRNQSCIVVGIPAVNK